MGLLIIPDLGREKTVSSYLETNSYCVSRMNFIHQPANPYLTTNSISVTNSSINNSGLIYSEAVRTLS